MIRRTVALAAILLVGGFAVPANATSQVIAGRLAGADRYATARAVAAHQAFTGTTSVVVTSGTAFPDALTASSYGSPMVLTSDTGLPAESAASLDSLKQGRTKAIIVGGTNAVPETVADQVRAKGYEVRRVAGPDRYSTAAFVAQEHTPVLVNGSVTAIVVSARSFSDALTAAPTGIPLLLVERDSVPAATASALDAMGVKQVIIVGGTSAVSQAVQTSLSTPNRSVTRLAGASAIDTAITVADYELGPLGRKGVDVVLTSATSFADGITGGSLGVPLQAPILFAAARLPVQTENFLDAHSSSVARIWVVGGTNAVPESAVTAAKNAAANTGNDKP